MYYIWSCAIKLRKVLSVKAVNGISLRALTRYHRRRRVITASKILSREAYLAASAKICIRLSGLINR